MSSKSLKDTSPEATIKKLREKLLSGSTLLVEDLSDNELAAMSELLLEDQVEIISSACRPYLAAKLDRTII